MALTANDPLNDQREPRKIEKQNKMVRKIFNNPHTNIL